MQEGDGFLVTFIDIEPTVGFLFFKVWEPDLFYPITAAPDELRTLLVMSFPKVLFTCPEKLLVVPPIGCLESLEPTTPVVSDLWRPPLSLESRIIFMPVVCMFMLDS